MNTIVANSTATVADFDREQAEPREQEGDHGGGEDLEEALDPQVHQPPAPVLDHRQLSVLVPHQACAVEQADRHRRQEQQRDDRPAFAPAAHGRPQRAADEHEPEQQPDEQEPLPEAADVGVFPALVAEPEVAIQAELLHHREPLAGERADHDDQQADPQQVDAEALELRLVPGDRRARCTGRCRARPSRSTAPRAACARCA